MADYVLLRKGVTSATSGTGDLSAPAAAATQTIYDSGANGVNRGARFKSLLLTLYSSHVSGTDGVKFQRTVDGGTNWRDIVTYTLPATTLTTYIVDVNYDRWRVTYTNSSNTLTTYEMELLGDPCERSD